MALTLNDVKMGYQVSIQTILADSEWTDQLLCNQYCLGYAYVLKYATYGFVCRSHCCKRQCRLQMPLPGILSVFTYGRLNYVLIANHLAHLGCIIVAVHV